MNVEDVIKEILVTKIYVEVSPDEIRATDHFHRDLGVDSLGFVELRSEVEERFAIVVPDDDFTPDNFVSVESLVAYVEKARAVAATK